MYTINIRQARRNEIDFVLPLRKRSPTYENELTNFEANRLSDLLCNIKLYAEGQSLSLPSSVSDQAMSLSQSLSSMSLSQVESDFFFYIIFNSFKTNFLSFSKEFFQGAQVGLKYNVPCYICPLFNVGRILLYCKRNIQSNMVNLLVIYFRGIILSFAYLFIFDIYLFVLCIVCYDN